MAGPHRILVVDDEEGLVRLFRRALQTDERAVLTAMNGRDALALFRAERPELVILDLKLPDRDGMTILRDIMEIAPETSVIILTAHGNTSTTIEAMRLGAYDYITKPFDLLKVKIIVDKALEKQALKREIDSLRRQLTGAPPAERLMGQHPAMQQVYKMIGQVADTDAAVLIRGETGTGKELVARTIHESSRRRDNALVAVDCASFAETLLESELFGHERGSFTGAFKRKLGKFELAHHGTLFLDEIGNVSTGVQAKLLRFLQEKTIERVGGTETIEVDTRIIAATSLNIEEAVRKKQFREDLFYRLNVVPIHLPPLRERQADIPLLAEHFLRLYSTSRRGEALHFAPAVLNCLLNYSWPGNVRQLQNAVERAAVMTQGSVITLDNLPPEVRSECRETGAAEPLPGTYTLEGGRSFDEAVGEFERSVLRHALEQTDWNQTSAARLLGMSFRAMRYRVKKYGLRTRDADPAEEPAPERSRTDTPRQHG